MRSPNSSNLMRGRPIASWIRPVQRALHICRFYCLRFRSRGALSAASCPVTAKGVKILPSSRVSLGSRVALGRNMYVETDLVVGDDVLFSGNVAIVGNIHPLDAPGTVFASSQGLSQTVIIDGDNLIGYGAILIGPCHLKRGAVIGAGAVATGTFDEDTIYVGVPAKPLRTRRR